MSKKIGAAAGGKADRLAAALRENLRKRKAQQRGRADHPSETDPTDAAGSDAGAHSDNARGDDENET